MTSGRIAAIAAELEHADRRRHHYEKLLTDMILPRMEKLIETLAVVGTSLKLEIDFDLELHDAAQKEFVRFLEAQLHPFFEKPEATISPKTATTWCLQLIFSLKTPATGSLSDDDLHQLHAMPAMPSCTDLWYACYGPTGAVKVVKAEPPRHPVNSSKRPHKDYDDEWGAPGAESISGIYNDGPW